jgi:hypothetical protein
MAKRDRSRRTPVEIWRPLLEVGNLLTLEPKRAITTAQILENSHEKLFTLNLQDLPHNTRFLFPLIRTVIPNLTVWDIGGSVEVPSDPQGCEIVSTKSPGLLMAPGAVPRIDFSEHRDLDICSGLYQETVVMERVYTTVTERINEISSNIEILQIHSLYFSPETSDGNIRAVTLKCLIRPPLDTTSQTV